MVIFQSKCLTSKEITIVLGYPQVSLMALILEAVHTTQHDNLHVCVIPRVDSMTTGQAYKRMKKNYFKTSKRINVLRTLKTY